MYMYITVIHHNRDCKSVIKHTTPRRKPSSLHSSRRFSSPPSCQDEGSPGSKSFVT